MTTTDEPTAEATEPRRRRVRPLVAVLAVVVLGLLAATVVTGVRLAHANSRADTRDAALAAARQEAVNFTTFDYRHLDRDLRTVMALSTGSFRSQFEKALGQVRTTIADQQTVSKGTVTAAGVESVDGARAVVIAAVDASVSSKGGKPAVKHYRMRISLQRTGGHWLVSGLAGVI